MGSTTAKSHPKYESALSIPVMTEQNSYQSPSKIYQTSLDTVADGKPKETYGVPQAPVISSLNIFEDISNAKPSHGSPLTANYDSSKPASLPSNWPVYPESPDRFANQPLTPPDIKYGGFRPAILPDPIRLSPAYQQPQHYLSHPTIDFGGFNALPPVQRPQYTPIISGFNSNRYSYLKPSNPLSYPTTVNYKPVPVTPSVPLYSTTITPLNPTSANFPAYGLSPKYSLPVSPTIPSTIKTPELQGYSYPVPVKQLELPRRKGKASMNNKPVVASVNPSGFTSATLSNGPFSSISSIGDRKQKAFAGFDRDSEIFVDDNRFPLASTKQIRLNGKLSQSIKTTLKPFISFADSSNEKKKSTISSSVKHFDLNNNNKKIFIQLPTSPRPSAGGIHSGFAQTNIVENTRSPFVNKPFGLSQEKKNTFDQQKENFGTLGNIGTLPAQTGQFGGSAIVNAHSIGRGQPNSNERNNIFPSANADLRDGRFKGGFNEFDNESARNGQRFGNSFITSQGGLGKQKENSRGKSFGKSEPETNRGFGSSGKNGVTVRPTNLDISGGQSASFGGSLIGRNQPESNRGFESSGRNSVQLRPTIQGGSSSQGAKFGGNRLVNNQPNRNIGFGSHRNSSAQTRPANQGAFISPRVNLGGNPFEKNQVEDNHGLGSPGRKSVTIRPAGFNVGVNSVNQNLPGKKPFVNIRTTPKDNISFNRGLGSRVGSNNFATNQKQKVIPSNLNQGAFTHAATTIPFRQNGGFSSNDRNTNQLSVNVPKRVSGRDNKAGVTGKGLLGSNSFPSRTQTLNVDLRKPKNVGGFNGSKKTSVRRPLHSKTALIGKLAGNNWNSGTWQKFGPGGFRKFNETLGPEVCQRAGLFRHPTDCTQFYECYWDKWIEKFTLHIFPCPVAMAA